MSMELTLLGWSVVMLVVHFLVPATFAVGRQGLPWAAGPRDESPKPAGRYQGRAQRALDNFKETYPAFIALALGLAVAGKAGGVGTSGAELWFGARVLYLPVYMLGVPWLRTLIYVAACAGLGMMLVKLLS